VKQNVYVIGVGMTRFGKHLDRTLKSLGAEAVRDALDDAGLEGSDIEAAWMGNAAASIITGQVCVPGQVVLRSLGVGKIPVVNVENACATASTAFQQACSMVTFGAYDVVLAAGVEKLYCEDRRKIAAVFEGAIDVDARADLFAYMQKTATAAGMEIDPGDIGKNRSLFMDIYAAMTRNYMRKSGATKRHFAMVSAKNSYHGSLNPRAQYRDVLSVEDVLSARVIAEPLTLPMCSPIGDGAAAAVIVSEKKLRELGIGDAVRVLSSAIMSGWDYEEGDPTVTEAVAAQAYEEAAIGPGDLACVELHDASSPAEMMYYEYLGLCEKGGALRLIEDGETRLGGRIPVNTSGGLVRKGHPIGATGLAQIFELTEQLRGRAGKRQVEGAKMGLAENGGGFIGEDAAAITMTVLAR